MNHYHLCSTSNPPLLSNALATEYSEKLFQRFPMVTQDPFFVVSELKVSKGFNLLAHLSDDHVFSAGHPAFQGHHFR